MSDRAQLDGVGHFIKMMTALGIVLLVTSAVAFLEGAHLDAGMFLGIALAVFFGKWRMDSRLRANSEGET